MKTKPQKRRKIVLGMLVAIALSFVSYSYAIASTTFSTSDSRAKNIEIQDLQTEIAELEVDYFNMMNNISVVDAEEYGLREIKLVGYASTEQKITVAYNN